MNKFEQQNRMGDYYIVLISEWSMDLKDAPVTS